MRVLAAKLQKCALVLALTALGLCLTAMDCGGWGEEDYTYSPRMSEPQWSPDGQRIVAGIQGSIYVTGTDGADLETVYKVGGSAEAHSPRISPDGSRIVYARGHRDGLFIKGPLNYELVTSSLNGSGYRRLTKSDAQEVHPVWSPDGTRIAFLSDRLAYEDIHDDRYPGRAFTLFTMASDGSDIQSLAPDVLTVRAPVAWSPDGRYLAFAGSDPTALAVYTIRSDGSDLRRLSGTTSLSAWSPDGSSIAFFKEEDNVTTLFGINPDGSGLREIVRMGGYRAHALFPLVHWSSDGSEIRLGGDPLIVAQVDGSGFRVLHGLQVDGLLASWSPDGSRIAVYTRFRSYSPDGDRGVLLFTMLPDGSDKRVLIEKDLYGQIVSGAGRPWTPGIDWKEASGRSARDSQSPRSVANEPPELPCAGTLESVGSCSQRDVSGVGLFTPAVAGAAYDLDDPIPDVEEILDKGLYAAGASPVHIAFRGETRPGSVRCAWRGVARTLTQREELIRFWLGMDDDETLPSPSEVQRRFIGYVDRMGPSHRETMRASLLALARGGLTTDYSALACYVGYDAAEYLLGGGSTTITIAYDMAQTALSYELYVRVHRSGRFEGELLKSESEHMATLNQTVWEAESLMRDLLEGRESVLFLAPMGAHNAIGVEAWQVVAQWDLQMAEDRTVNAVRYGADVGDPEHTQTLANLRSRISAATSTGTSETPAVTRIENVSGLTQYYRDIGAYGDITPGDGETTTFTPSQPPAVYASAPATLTATASGEEGADLSWGSVTGATGYRVEHRLDGSDGLWTTAVESTTGTTYSVSGLLCGSTHEFRVGAHGDGTTYNARPGLWSDTATAATDACTPQPPRFGESSYSFEVSAAAMAGDVVGTVSATDVNGDAVSYSITSGNEAGRFAIGSATGEITLAGPPGPSGTVYTLTAGAADGVSGTTTVTVTVAVTAPEARVGEAARAKGRCRDLL